MRAAVGEAGLDAIASVVEPDQAVAEMDALRREARGDDREQVGAVHGQVRRAVELLAARVERRPLQRAAVLPAPLVRAERPHRLAVERVAEAEPIENPRRVRPHVDAAADFGQLRRLLVDLNVEAGLVQGHGGGETADAGADDGDRERGDVRHDDATLHQQVADEHTGRRG